MRRQRRRERAAAAPFLPAAADRAACVCFSRPGPAVPRPLLEYLGRAGMCPPSRVSRGRPAGRRERRHVPALPSCRRWGLLDCAAGLEPAALPRLPATAHTECLPAVAACRRPQQQGGCRTCPSPCSQPTRGPARRRLEGGCRTCPPALSRHGGLPDVGLRVDAAPASPPLARVPAFVHLPLPPAARLQPWAPATCRARLGVITTRGCYIGGRIRAPDVNSGKRLLFQP